MARCELPNFYLFSCYIDKNGKPIPKQHKPVFNQLIFAADPASAKLKEGEPIVLRSDRNGIIKPLIKGSLKAGPVAYDQRVTLNPEKIS